MHAGSKEFYCRYGFHYRPAEEKLKHGKNDICIECKTKIEAEKVKRPKDNAKKLDRFAKWVR